MSRKGIGKKSSRFWQNMKLKINDNERYLLEEEEFEEESLD